MKGIYLSGNSIGYRDIPKTACTSIKTALYKLETGKEFSAEEVGMLVHRYYNMKTTNISDAEFKFIIIRDPIKRFLSSYSNRVKYHGQLSKKYLEKSENGKLLLKKKTIPVKPSLSDFIRYLNEYLTIPAIRKHTKPAAEWLDKPLEFFDEVYKIEELYKLEKDISDRTKKEFILPRLQTGGEKISVNELGVKELEFLIDFYKEDYILLKDFYTVDEIYKTWKENGTQLNHTGTDT